MQAAEKRGGALRSIHQPDARVSVMYQEGDVEVIALEVEAGASLLEPALWVGRSWHLVVEGQAIFEQQGRRWELLPQESLLLGAAAPYTIRNLTPGRLKLLTLLLWPEGVCSSAG